MQPCKGQVPLLTPLTKRDIPNQWRNIQSLKIKLRYKVRQLHGSKNLAEPATGGIGVR